MKYESRKERRKKSYGSLREPSPDIPNVIVSALIRYGMEGNFEEFKKQALKVRDLYREVGNIQVSSWLDSVINPNEERPNMWVPQQTKMKDKRPPAL